MKAQYPGFFGQYMFTHLAINPAYAGSTGLMNATMVYRNQWTGFPGAPKTQMLTFHAPLKDKRNNFGFLMGFDAIGVSRQFLLQGIYAYRIDAGKVKLALGLQGGLSSLQNRWENLDLPDPGDGAFPLNTPAVFIPQVGTGFYMNHESFYLGISVPELLKYKGAQYRVFFSKKADFRIFFISGGVLLKASNNLKVKPSFLLKYSKSSKFQIDLNVNLIIKDLIWVGTSFRTNDAVLGIVQFQANQQIRIGYVYERSTSPLRYWNSGTHEILLSYDFKFRLKTTGVRYF